ncbi:5701_t:CDS:2 [Cetraspora pellucida]|uniref:5701_t:CDS:1 n=1 Tax=Cetraspora pellucida TaxID=1433469 RepID=A0A9N9FGV5_9GLOM|nr:5701_t:CDS:2 [Cetraspora pellucida]
MGFFDSYNSTRLSAIKEEALCYSLPYGVLGAAGWVLALITTVRVYMNDPKERNLSYKILRIITTIGPIIYTSIRCNANWEFILIAFSRLGPWACTMAYDRIERTKEEKSEQINLVINKVLVCASIALPVIGIVAVFQLIMVELENINSKWQVVLCIIFSVIVILGMGYCCGKCLNCCMCCLNKRASEVFVYYFVITTNIFVIDSFLAALFDDTLGIPHDTPGLVSAIIFLIGKNWNMIGLICDLLCP